MRLEVDLADKQLCEVKDYDIFCRLILCFNISVLKWLCRQVQIDDTISS